MYKTESHSTVSTVQAHCHTECKEHFKINRFVKIRQSVLVVSRFMVRHAIAACRVLYEHFRAAAQCWIRRATLKLLWSGAVQEHSRCLAPVTAESKWFTVFIRDSYETGMNLAQWKHPLLPSPLLPLRPSFLFIPLSPPVPGIPAALLQTAVKQLHLENVSACEGALSSGSSHILLNRGAA